MDSDISTCACMRVHGACAYMRIGYMTSRECDVIHNPYRYPVADPRGWGVGGVVTPPSTILNFFLMKISDFKSTREHLKPSQLNFLFAMWKGEYPLPCHPPLRTDHQTHQNPGSAPGYPWIAFVKTTLD